MHSSIVFHHNGVILDASCLINLSGSGRLVQMIASLPVPVVVATHVQTEETLWTFTGPDDDVTRTKQSIELQPLIDEGRLHLVDIETEAEALTMVNYAAVMDDGEAMTGALAVHHNWAIGVDDGKARAVFAREAPQIQLVSTLELVRHWAEHIDVSRAEIRHTLHQIRSRGKYTPHSSHPQYTWWRIHSQTP